jgi:hypothetical protein
MDDIFDDFPEFTTTTQSDSSIGGNAAPRHLIDMHVLKGFSKSNGSFESLPWTEGTLLAGPGAESRKVSIRGVRSATPRFVKP